MTNVSKTAIITITLNISNLLIRNQSQYMFTVRKISSVCNICHLCTFTENYERNDSQFRAYNGVDCFAAAAIRHARYTIQQEAKLSLG